MFFKCINLLQLFISMYSLVQKDISELTTTNNVMVFMP